MLLDYAGEAVIGFDDGTYRWVSVKRFGWDGRGTDAAVLAGLICHPEYRDDADDPDPEPRHGPYGLAAITAAAFDQVGADRVADAVDQLCRLHPHPPRPDILARVEAEAVAPLAVAACYSLRHLSEAVIFGGVFLEFQEFVGIARAAGTVLLVVLAADV